MATKSFGSGSATPGGFWRSLAIQRRVVGAILMREIHTRYGRENIGYLWLIGEPAMLATVIGLIHSGEKSRFGTDIHPLPFAVLGYTIFVMFRNIVNRSEGAVEANASLLYHRMVSVFDIMLGRSLVDAAGTFATAFLMMSALVLIGEADPPARPLYLIGAMGLMFWCSLSQTLILMSLSHDNRTIGRLIHAYTYLCIPASCAFTQLEWIPEPYRTYMSYTPLPNIFEMARYGYFESAPSEYFSLGYLVGLCMVLTYLGLVLINRLREHVHVN